MHLSRFSRAIFATAVAASLTGCGGAGRTAAERCEAAGAKPDAPNFDSCVRQEEERQADGARRVLNGIPVTGYGPMRF
ncbi:hypothetical protein [Hansschlegelia zhihuaiae]|uniref:Lipoprotein n=1 Tax=Hansschlegelia zhihuaiae TaxID=405005 RepID=A0A4Q0MMI6_9HYPH|nr:hypothetical protein [Hansschlegelia zhihuaiae]RXF74970.1 hypothetical protein EK403_02610 [Hansschlegelia zhihuaiae]